MEQLRTELSHLLGEKLSRVECVRRETVVGAVVAI
jgi:hypothetical protein